MLVISSGKRGYFSSSPHHRLVFFLSFFFSLGVVLHADVLLLGSNYQSVSVVADAFIASFCTNFPKEFAILGKQLFLLASVCISYNCNAWPASH